jgi:hypothetical protein
MTSRGIRNNNPGNIDYNPNTKWQGLDEPPIESTPANGRARFARFKTPAFGIRALARTLITYQDKHDLNTVEEIINRWAPPVENDTTSYINSVAAKIGVVPKQHVSVHDFNVMLPLVEAIIRHENGSQPYSREVLEQGLIMAGVPPKPKPVVKSPAAQATATATVTTTTAGAIDAVQKTGVVDTIQQSIDTVTPISYYLDFAKYILLALTVALMGFTLWRVAKSNSWFK